MEPKSTEQADDVPVEVQWDAEASEDSSVFETRNDENGRRRHPPRNSATAIGPLLVVIAFIFALTACVLLFYFMWQSVG